MANTEIWLEPGGDFVQLPNGDLKLAQDTTTSSDATRQRIQRVLLTNPRGINAGNATSAPDDLFHPDFGAGLPALVGQPIPIVRTQATARINRWLALQPGIVPGSLVVQITQLDIATVQVYVACKTAAGTVVETTFPLAA